MASNDITLSEQQIVVEEKESDFWVIYSILEFCL